MVEAVGLVVVRVRVSASGGGRRMRRRRRRGGRSGGRKERIFLFSLFSFGEAEEQEDGDREDTVEQLAKGLVFGADGGARANLFLVASVTKVRRVWFASVRSYAVISP